MTAFSADDSSDPVSLDVSVEGDVAPHLSLRPEDHEDFQPFLRALSRADDFTLYFAECNVPTYRKKVADVVRENLTRPVVDLSLWDVDRSDLRPALDYVLEQQLEGAPDDAVAFVWGLEYLLPSSPDDVMITQYTVSEMNLRRGAWERLEHPVVFWLPSYAFPYLARHAPDFFDWNSGTFVFNPPAKDRQRLFETSMSPFSTSLETSDDLTVAHKRKREGDLRALKAEYCNDTPADLKARTDVARRLAELYRSQSSFEQAFREARESLTAADKVGYLKGRANALYELGAIYEATGDFPKAQAITEASLKIRQETRDQSGKAASLHQLGTVALSRGNLSEARTHTSEALEIARAVKDQDREAALLHQMGAILISQSDHATALKWAETSLRIFQETGSQAGEAAALHQLGSIAMEQGDYKAALTHLSSSLKIKREIGDQLGEAATLHQLGSVAIRQGEYESARQQLKESLTIRRKVGISSEEAKSLHQLGTVAMETDDYERARNNYKASLDIFQQIGDESGETATLYQLQALAIKHKDFNAAKEYLIRLLKTQRGSSNRSEEAFSLVQLGLLAAGPFGRPSKGFPILLTGYVILNSVDHAGRDEVDPLVDGIATYLELTQEEFDAAVASAMEAYQKDGGRALIEAAFEEDLEDDEV